MRRTSEITGNCPDTTKNTNFMSALIVVLKSTLNGTHIEREETNLKVMIKNAKEKLIALYSDQNGIHVPSHDIEMQPTYTTVK
jgi:hypothetical protein